MYKRQVSANSELTLSTNLIDYPYTIEEIQIGFPPGVDRTVQIKVFISSDSSTPSSGEPVGTNIFRFVGPNDYIVGDDETVRIPIALDVDNTPTWIKVYANNTDSYDHTVDVKVLIDLHAPDTEKQHAT